MKRVLILSPSIYGKNANANGLCAACVAKEFQSNGIDVEVIAFSSEGCNKFSFPIHEIQRGKRKKAKNNKTTLFSKFFAFLKVIRYLIIGVTYNKDDVLNFYNATKNICLTKSVDVIVGIFFPFETAIALKRLKKEFPAITTCVFQLDEALAIDNGKISTRLIRLSYARLMGRTYNTIDRVIVMRSHEKTWRSEYKYYRKKLVVSDLPVLSKWELKDCIPLESRKENSLTFIYSGILNKNYRSPVAVIELFKQSLLNNYDYVLYFYSKGNCEDYLLKESINNDKIKLMGFVDNDILKHEIEKANFLINIGNLNSNSVPSKLIMYLSTGKPIIHFAYSKSDSCLFYLNQYPNSLVLYVNDPLDYSAKKLSHFLEVSHDKRISFDSVAKTFFMNDPKFSCNLILKGEG